MAYVTTPAAHIPLGKLIINGTTSSAMPDDKKHGKYRNLATHLQWKGKKIRYKNRRWKTSRWKNSRHGKSWRNSGRWRPILHIVLVLSFPAPYATAATATLGYVTACSRTSPDDLILDADDVKTVEEKGIRHCNLSSKGYKYVCENAFHNSACEAVDLSNNNLANLSGSLFSHADRLRELYVRHNQLVQAPYFQSTALQAIIYDQNPLRCIPDNYAAGLPSLSTLLLQNCPNLSSVNIQSFSCESLHISLKVIFIGTPIHNLQDLVLDCVNVTVNENGPPSVTCTCYNGNDKTFQVENVEQLKEIKLHPTPIPTKSDHRMTNVTPLSVTLTKDVSLDEHENGTNKSAFGVPIAVPVVILFLLAVIIVVLWVCPRSRFLCRLMQRLIQRLMQRSPFHPCLSQNMNDCNNSCQS